MFIKFVVLQYVLLKIKSCRFYYFILYLNKFTQSKSSYYFNFNCLCKWLVKTVRIWVDRLWLLWMDFSVSAKWALLVQSRICNMSIAQSILIPLNCSVFCYIVSVWQQINKISEYSGTDARLWKTVLVFCFLLLCSSGS